VSKGGIAVKEIIEKISRIDTEAYEDEQRKKIALLNERKRLEEEIAAYRQNEISKAEEKAHNIYKKIVGKAREDYKKQEDEINKQCNNIENNYEKVESAVLDEVFSKLFSDIS
jgi:GTPase involved in cell partitioning and DNA repair